MFEKEWHTDPDLTSFVNSRIHRAGEVVFAEVWDLVPKAAAEAYLEEKHRERMGDARRVHEYRKKAVSRMATISGSDGETVTGLGEVPELDSFELTALRNLLLEAETLGGSADRGLLVWKLAGLIYKRQTEERAAEVVSLCD